MVTHSEHVHCMTKWRIRHTQSLMRSGFYIHVEPFGLLNHVETSKTVPSYYVVDAIIPTNLIVYFLALPSLLYPSIVFILVSVLFYCSRCNYPARMRKG